MSRTRIARPTRGLAAFLVLFCTHILCIHAEKPSHTPDAHGRIPFDVYFETTAPLGLRLDASLRVMGFSKTADGRIAPAEEAKWILPGDSLVAVNGKSVTSVGLNAAVLAIRDATLPKVLTFVPSKPGEDRAAEMEQLVKEEEGDTSSFKGVFELAVVGTHADTEAQLYPMSIATVSRGGHNRRALAFKFPVIKAHFGTLTSCHRTKVIVADPSDACGSFSNERQLSNAIVIAERGICQFSDKAINAQVADAAAIVVLNDDGPAFRMPKSDDDHTSVNIPAVMVSKEDAKTIRRILNSAADTPFADVVGRIIMYNQVCKETFFLPVTPESEAANAQENMVKSGSGVTLADGTTADAESGGTISLGFLKPGDIPSLEPVFKFEYVAADFGGSLATALSKPRQVTIADPIDACSPLTNTPSDLFDAVVIVDRGQCPFEEKYDIVKAAGGAVMAVANSEHIAFPMPSLNKAFNRRISSVAESASVEVSADGDGSAVMTSIETAAVMIPKATGQEVKRRVQEALGSGSAVFIGSPQPDATIRRHWDELETLLDHKNWPVDSKDRRKDYFKKSMHHHPDKPGGNKARFEVLNYAYRRANHRYDPENFEFIDDLE